MQSPRGAVMGKFCSYLACQLKGLKFLACVMGQHDHNMTDEKKSENSDESTITYQTVRFAELMQDSDMDEVDQWLMFLNRNVLND